MTIFALLVALLAVLAPAAPTGADGNEAPGNPFLFRSITAGGNHTCAIVHNGNVKCWGKNESGQLGLGDTASRGDATGEMGDNLPNVDLGTDHTATAVVAGSAHTCALLDNATVKCWGSNNNGQLGQDDLSFRGDGAGEMGDNLLPIILGSQRTAVAITAGTGHTCALLDNATVKCWGLGIFGQLGLGDTATRGDTAGEMGDLPAVNLGTGRTAVAIAAGGFHTCALLDNATVKCWGLNDSGQLGVGDTTNRGVNSGQMGDSLPALFLSGPTATALATGQNHTCVVLSDATARCWGRNSAGQLGRGTVVDGTGTGSAISLGTGRTATGITAGDNHTCARLDDATVKCWGDGGSGQLGTGTFTRGDAPGEMADSLPIVPFGTGHTATAVTAGGAHTCVVMDSYALKCWGLNADGQLGLGDTANRDSAGEMFDDLPEISLGGSRTATAIAAGTAHACALLDDATIKCWGSNSGQLGLGDSAARGDVGGEMGDRLSPVDLGTGRTALALAAGNSHNCALLDDHTVKCWGFNGNGQLGLGDALTRGDTPGELGDSLPTVDLGTGRTATAIRAGFGHTCALLDNGSVKCWGANSSGQLGQGDTIQRGDGAGEMGDNLPAIDLGTGRTATAIAAGPGGSHTCARLDNGSVKCWGRNSNGQLGLGDIFGHGPFAGDMGDNLPAVDLGTGRTAIAISANTSHTCAILDNHTLKCWGLNDRGQLGQEDTVTRGGAAGQMGDNLPAISLGTGRTARTIATGDSHTCAVLDNGSVKCWGRNLNGQLGRGETGSRGIASGDMGDNLVAANLGTGRTATALVAGDQFTCSLLDDDTVKCWGLNTFGRLGLGDVASRGDGAGEMGNSLPVVDLGSGRPSGISGTVVDSVSAAPVPGAFVVVMRTNDFSLAAGAVADGSGDYTATVPPGSYFAYVIDPTGHHTAGFSGPPTTFTVAADTVLDADLTAVPTRGTITGTITETGPNTPIAGSWAIALTNGGVAETGVVANGSGQFTLPGLNPANHFLAYVDPAGAHPSRFFPNSPNVPDATTIAVTAGATTNANGSLPTQTTVGTGAALTGTVTEQGTGTPLANVFVVALHAADFSIARGGLTNGSGNYNLDVVPGGYKLVYVDATGLHNAEWHNNQPASNLVDATTVTAPAATNATLNRNTGSMTGIIRDDPSNVPIAGAWVLAIGPTGIAGGAVTAPNGGYIINSLPPGTYRAVFVDPVGGRILEYFDNSPDYPGATPLTITAGASTIINAALAYP